MMTEAEPVYAEFVRGKTEMGRRLKTRFPDMELRDHTSPEHPLHGDDSVTLFKRQYLGGERPDRTIHVHCSYDLARAEGKAAVTLEGLTEADTERILALWEDLIHG